MKLVSMAANQNATSNVNSATTNINTNNNIADKLVKRTSWRLTLLHHNKCLIFNI